MLVRLLFILVCGISCQNALFATIKPIAPPCDTLITTAGQVLLVQLASSPHDSLLHFTYCGEQNGKTVVVKRAMIREIHLAPKLEASKMDSKNLPEGSEVVSESDRIPSGSEIVKTPLTKDEVSAINNWSKIGAIGGFGSAFMFLFAAAFNPIFALLILPLSILGAVFAIKVLRKTKKWKAEYKKQRKLSKWGLGMSFFWVGVIVLYIILFFIFILAFIV